LRESRQLHRTIRTIGIFLRELRVTQQSRAIVIESPSIVCHLAILIVAGKPVGEAWNAQ
jgi:hypothetical protein